jgi:prepilin-type processing-associated H-X9-DG protein
MTLVEVLAVIAVLAVLLAVLLPASRGAWQAYNCTRCTTNLRRIWEAYRAQGSDNAAGEAPDFHVRSWTALLAPYLEDRHEVFECPEGAADEGAGSGPDLAELVEFEVRAGSGTYRTPMEEGAWMVKLSNTQYENARARGLLGNDATADNLRDKYDCTYRPDARPNVYWLCMEDHGGDEDYKDVMTKVTEHPDGTIDLWFRAGFTGHHNSLIDKKTGSVVMHIPSNSEGLTYTVRGAATGPPTSYGMNLGVDESGGMGTTILALDYGALVAESTDLWTDPEWDPDEDGLPHFARHTGQINVLFLDGAIRLMAPHEIDPVRPSVADRYWVP